MMKYMTREYRMSECRTKEYIMRKYRKNKAKAISAKLLKLNLKIKMEERGKTR